MVSKWYKVIANGTLIGVATDQDFIRYSSEYGRPHLCTVADGQYIVVGKLFFHDDWMIPIDKNSYLEYEPATVVSISRKEYDELNYGTTDAVPVVDQTVPKEPVPEQKPDEIEEITVAYVRERKLKELSAACEKSIVDGFSLTLSDGASHHFSLGEKDQLNLLDLQRDMDADRDLIYHADGEIEQFYSQEDMIDILIGARKWKQYNLALYNSMKNWINHLEDLAEINAITYDSEIPEEYCSQVFLTLTENF